MIDFCLLEFEIAMHGFNSFELTGHYVNLEILYQRYYSFKNLLVRPSTLVRLPYRCAIVVTCRTHALDSGCDNHKHTNRVSEYTKEKGIRVFG